SSRLARCFKSLEAADFLRHLDQKATPDIQLLTNGQAYAEQLQQQWLNLRPLSANLGQLTYNDVTAQHRFSFVQAPQFKKQLQQLHQLYPQKFKCPTLLKHQRSLNYNSQSNSIFKHSLPVTQLITDYFVEAQRGLEHFYNVQRESKIWWMRYSSNPSRYSIVPYITEQQEGCQAIDIKANFGHEAGVTVEQLSLVCPPATADLSLPDARSGQMQQPAIIRSIIELEPASCTLLLDGCDHNREASSLLLSRAMAPYQCGVAARQYDNQNSADLHDLCAHVVDVLQRAKIRLHQSYTITQDEEQLLQQLQQFDGLGVPYTLLLDETEALSTGLLQLRSRDTQLAETVHISDLPNYLLNIFRN
ncbi:DNApol-gamma35, partial [Drosophila busckii]